MHETWLVKGKTCHGVSSQNQISCLVADQFRIRTKTFEITGAVNEKGLIQLWMMSLQKKTVLFCDGEVFSLDRGLLMGAIL